MKKLAFALLAVVGFVYSVLQVNADYQEGEVLWLLSAEHFCQDFAAQGECQPYGADEPEIVKLTPEMRWELTRVNWRTNLEIEYTPDISYGQPTDRWNIPADKGDCEDYAILKRRRLAEAGFPRRAMLLMVTHYYDPFEGGWQGHAVLLVRTNQGDFILDNNSNGIYARVDMPYRETSVQSAQDPRQFSKPKALPRFYE